MKPKNPFFLGSVIAITATASAHAQTWTGAAGADWNTGVNWSTNAVPLTTGDVVFDGTGANLNIALSAPGPLQSLTFTAGQTAAVNINTVAGSSSPAVAAANLSFGATATALTVAAGSGNHKITGTGTSAGTTFRDVAFSGALTSFTFDIGSGASFEISGRVGGGSLNAIYAKNSAGTLIFSGPNGGASAWQFTGASGMFNVNQGVVRLANVGASGNSGNKYTVANGAAIELSGGFAQALNSGTITLNGNGTTTDGALRSLGGNNSLTVTTGGGGVVLASHSRIGVDADTFTINPVVSGAFNLTKVGAGTLVLAGANTMSGSTTVNAGTLSLTKNLALQNSALVTTGAGTVTLDVTVTTPTFGGLSGATGDLATVISSGYSGVTALTLNPGTGSTVSHGGTIGDGVVGMILTKSGAGTQILTGSNTYTGATTISAGTLSVGTSANLGAAASNLVFDGGTLQITGTTLGNFSGIGHTVSFTAAKNVGLDVNDPGHSFTVDQVLNQTTGTFTKLGAGTAILNQVNTYTGATDISGGTLVIADVNAVQTSNLVRISTTAGSGTLRLSTDTPVTAFPISSSSSNPGTVVSDRATAGAGINHGFTSANMGANTYSFNSGLNVTGGTAGISFSTMSMTSGSAGTTVLNPTTATLTITGGVTSQTSDRLRTLDLGGTGTGHSIGGVITQTVASALSLTKSNTSTWSLSGTSTYSGATTLSGGTLSLGHATNTLPDATPISLGTATLAIGASCIDTVGTLDVTGAATIHLGSGTSALTFGDSSAKTWTGGTLIITGTFVPGASIKFGVGGLTGTQLTKISATGWTGFALDGSGYLTATAVGAGFSSWINGTFANGSVPGGKQGANDDPDNDGINNLVEYAIAGQDPTVSDSTIGSFTANTLSFTKRADASGLSYAIQESTDLGNLDDWTEVSGGSYVNNATSISYTLAPSAPEKNFIRLKVTGP